MHTVDVSVVIPTFRREQQVLEAIGSVLNQCGVTLEVIVVDDTPEGSAQAAVRSIADPRVRYLHRPEPTHERPAFARNDGARQARGRYLHFLDDDDLLEAGALGSLSGALEAAPAAGMAFGATVPFGADPIKLRLNQVYWRNARRIARRLRRAQDFSACMMFRPAITINSACMARRRIFEQMGGFDTQIPVCEDVDLWSRIADVSGYVFVDRAVTRYRTGAPSLMNSLVPDDPKLHVSYRHMQEKYRRMHGWWWSLMLQIRARAVLR